MYYSTIASLENTYPPASLPGPWPWPLALRVADSGVDTGTSTKATPARCGLCVFAGEHAQNPRSLRESHGLGREAWGQAFFRDAIVHVYHESISGVPLLPLSRTSAGPGLFLNKRAAPARPVAYLS